MENITTIQLRESVKRLLDLLKERNNETYEDVIIKLLDEKEKDRDRLEKLMIEECKEMAEENLRIAKEFDSALMDGLDKDENWIMIL